jgi:hypothetical protein
MIRRRILHRQIVRHFIPFAHIWGQQYFQYFYTCSSLFLTVKITYLMFISSTFRIKARITLRPSVCRDIEVELWRI